ncbi:MAG: hypothetical protein V4568_00055 [Pseudomonadota bacterium]
MKHLLTLSHRATRWIAWIFFLSLPVVSNAYPVRAGSSWALTTTGNLVSCANGAACYPAQGEIAVTTPRTIRFTTQYQGPTVSFESANAYVFVANHGAGTATFTTRVTNVTTGAVLATGMTTTSYLQGSSTCAQRGLSPSTNAQPLLLSPVAGVLLATGSTVEMTISITSTQPVNLGVCVGMTDQSFTTSTLNLGGFIVPNFDAPTPVCGSTATPDASGKFSFEVVGSHAPTSSWVSLDATGVPTGATLTPPLPVRGNPVSTRFSWAPPRTQVGRFDVTFTVSDEGATTKDCKIHFDLGPRVLPKELKESILVSPPDFPQKVTFETVCREYVADVCLSRDLVEICVGGKCFGVPQQKHPPCKLCELERGLRQK